MTRAVEVGLGLSTMEDAAARARQIETAGFDRLFCGEHLFFHGPVPNAFVALAAAAGATERIKLLSSVTLLPLYPAAVAAKMASALDVVSGGRFNFGIGVGGEYSPEFDAVGVPVKERGKRTDEALEAIGLLFSGEKASFAGAWTSFEGVRLDPPPVQPGGPPIWIAGRGEAAMRRAGRFADVWMPYMFTPEMLAESLETVARHAREHGRTTTVPGGIYLFICVDRDGDRARKSIVESVGGGYKQDFSGLAHYLVAGAPAECVERLREYVDAGAEFLNFQLSGPDEVQERSLALLIEDVLPELRST